MRLLREDGLNLKDFQLFQSLKDKHFCPHKKMPTALGWNAGGSCLVTGEQQIKAWHLTNEGTLDKVHACKGHETNIECIRFYNDNLYASISRDTLKLWDLRQATKVFKSQKSSKSDLIKCTWNHTTDPVLALLRKEGIVQVYDVKNTSIPIAVINPKSINGLQATAVEWDGTDSVMYVGCHENSTGSVAVMRASDYSLIQSPINVHCGRVTDLVVHREKIATGSEDSLISLMVSPDMVCARVFSHKTDSAVKCLSFSCDGRYVAASADCPFIQIYNAQNGGTAYRIMSSINQDSLAWHPNLFLLAYIDETEEDNCKRSSVDRSEVPYVHLLQNP